MAITRTYVVRYVPRWHVYRYNMVNPPSIFEEDRADWTIPAQYNSASSEKYSDWRQRIKRHQTATTGRQIDRFSAKGGFGTGETQFLHMTSLGPTVAGETWTGHFLYPSSFPALPSSYADADNQARMKFLKRAKEAQTAFRSLTALGELRETLRMLRNPAKRLRSGLDDYVKSVTKRTRRAKRTNLNRIVSETWLEHVFGWSPFIADIKSAGDGLNRRLNRFAGSYTRVSGLGRQETAAFDASLNATGTIWFQYVTRRLHLTYGLVRYVGQVRSVCENPVMADAQLFGANWREIVPTAWELIPYSFLADYFTNIGDVLDAWSLRRSDIAWSNKTIRLRGQRKLAEVRINKAAIESTVTSFIRWQTASFSVSPFRSVRERILRQAETPGLPSIQMEIPGFGTKWINMTALLAARNRTRRQMFR